jgi:ketosteroid isomerase-like protein
MGQETVETISKTWMERVWNQLDTSAIDELIADGHVSYGAGDPIEGKAGWHDFHAAFTAAFSDIRITVEDQVVSGDKAASRWTGTMVHRASGTPVTLSGMLVVRVREGQVVEGWNLIDFLPLLTTLGIIPPDSVQKALAPG